MKLKVYFIIILSCFFIGKSHGQQAVMNNEGLYHVNYKVEVPLTAGLHIMNYYGFKWIKDKPRLTNEQVQSLNINDVWFLDRVALKQKTTQRLKAHNRSDVALNVSLFLPAVMFLDKEIRKEWLDFSLIYLEAHGFNSQLYVWGGPMFSKRIRPFVYYNQIDYAEKMDSGTTDSWFSGHVSSTATSSFFMAKVYNDYHPELGNKKWLLYAAALIPPAIVAYYRVRALKHFPTDVIAGTAVGAAVGILTPELHKIKNKHNKLTIVPYAGQVTGLYLVVKL